jgi:hypothetical protein
MAQPIDNQLVAESLVLPHLRNRTFAIAAAMLGAAILVGIDIARTPIGFWWVWGLLVGAALAYVGLALAFDAARGVPLLRASDSGIAINSPLGRMFVGWPDTAEFSQGIFDFWLRIRLREGAPPSGSLLTRILNASLWKSSTLAIPLFTTGRDAAEIGKALTQMRSRKLAPDNSTVT